jgi:hypothetical protein
MSKVFQMFPVRQLAWLVRKLWMLIRVLLFPVTWSISMVLWPFRLAYRIIVAQFPNVLAATIAVVSFGFISANFGSATVDTDLLGDYEDAPEVSFDLGADLGESTDFGGGVDLGDEADFGAEADFGEEADFGDDVDLGGEEDLGAEADLAADADAVEEESVEESVEVASASTHSPSTRLSLFVNVAMLEKAEAVLAGLPGYTATFSKQEVVADELTDEQVMQVKIRHEPFSVYMKWVTGHKGRQLLYVKGQNANRMLVKLGGWKKKLPALKLDPSGSMAMKESRYPITKAGLLELVRESLAIRRGDLARSEGIRCRLIENQEFDGRPCYGFVVEYSDPKVSKRYRKTEMLIDCQLGVPVVVRNFSWPTTAASVADLDADTLVECYTYRNIKFQREVARGDFDRGNKAYRF